MVRALRGHGAGGALGSGAAASGALRLWAGVRLLGLSFHLSARRFEMEPLCAAGHGGQAGVPAATAVSQAQQTPRATQGT